MNWQEIVVSGIVAAAFLLVVRSFVRSHHKSGGVHCGSDCGCSAGNHKAVGATEEEGKRG
jgi:hypothetical protein